VSYADETDESIPRWLLIRPTRFGLGYFALVGWQLGGLVFELLNRAGGIA